MIRSVNIHHNAGDRPLKPDFVSNLSSIRECSITLIPSLPDRRGGGPWGGWNLEKILSGKRTKIEICDFSNCTNAQLCSVRSSGNNNLGHTLRNFSFFWISGTEFHQIWTKIKVVPLTKWQKSSFFWVRDNKLNQIWTQFPHALHTSCGPVFGFSSHRVNSWDLIDFDCVMHCILKNHQLRF